MPEAQRLGPTQQFLEWQIELPVLYELPPAPAHNGASNISAKRTYRVAVRVGRALTGDGTPAITAVATVAGADVAFRKQTAVSISAPSNKCRQLTAYCPC